MYLRLDEYRTAVVGVDDVVTVANGWTEVDPFTRLGVHHLARVVSDTQPVDPATVELDTFAEALLWCHGFAFDNLSRNTYISCISFCDILLN